MASDMLLGNEWHSKATGQLVASIKLNDTRTAMLVTVYDESVPDHSASVTLRDPDEVRSIIETLEDLLLTWRFSDGSSAAPAAPGGQQHG